MLKLLLRVQTPIQHTLIDTLIKTAHALVRTGIFARDGHAERARREKERLHSKMLFAL